MADDEELLGGLFGGAGLFSGGGQPPWMNALSALSSIPTRRERLMGRGGYTPAMPMSDNRGQQAAMLRQWQQQNEVEDLTRIQDALAGSLEATGGEYGDEAITGYLTLRGTQPWRSPIGAQKGLEVVSKLREKGIAQREERTRAGIYDEVLEGNPNANPMELLSGMVQRGAAKGFDVSDAALKIAQLKQRGMHVFNNNGILSFVDENNRTQPVTTQGAQIFGPVEGRPAFAIRPDPTQPSGFSGWDIPGTPFQGGDKPLYRVPRQGPQQLTGPAEEEMPEQLGGPEEEAPRVPSLRPGAAPATMGAPSGPVAPPTGPGGYEVALEGRRPEPPPGMEPTQATIGGVTYKKPSTEPRGASTETERSAQALVERDLRARGESRAATPDEIALKAQEIRTNLAAATRGAGAQAVADVNLDQPVGMKRNRFRRSSDNTSPPPDYTVRRAMTEGYVETTDAQLGELADLQKAHGLIHGLFAQVTPLITAETPVQMGQQYLRLQAGRATNPQVSAYVGTSGAFLGNLSRSVAAEKGVLTNVDIARMAGALGWFNDTKASLAIKRQVFDDIMRVADAATKQKIFGEAVPPEAYRPKIDDLLEKLEGVGTGPKRGAPKGVPAPEGGDTGPGGGRGAAPGGKIVIILPDGRRARIPADKWSEMEAQGARRE